MTVVAERSIIRTGVPAEFDPVYQVGFQDGRESLRAVVEAMRAEIAELQNEVIRANQDADRFYRAAFSDERRVILSWAQQMDMIANRANSATDCPPSVTREQALASWGLAC